MIFWLVCAVMTLVVMVMIVTPLLRPKDVGDDNPDIAIYRAQLDEIDRDLERDLLAPDEAERARTEIARRLLAANKEIRPDATTTAPTRAIPLLIVVIGAGLSFWIYTSLGAPGYGDLP